MSNIKYLFSIIKIILLKPIQYTYITYVLLDFTKKCFIINYIIGCI
jgi:hypothetical protein